MSGLSASTGATGSTASTASTAAEKPPVDPGALPAWEVGDLPPPLPFGWRHLLALIGPGIVLIGSSLGTGEWVMGPATAYRYGGALLWVVPVAILCQAFLNTEAMRYTLITGEPIFTGFLRSKPGPRFWLVYYLLLDCLSWWPALAGLSAQVILAALAGGVIAENPSEVFQDPAQVFRVKALASGILVFCVVMLLFGGKIYNTLEWVLSGKVFFALGYTLFLSLFLVPPDVWARIVGGMVNPFVQPVSPQGQPVAIDWGLIGSLAGFAGVGGFGNILSSNYVREKGWGMGARVGAIASAFGAHNITLSHLGTMARPTPEAVERFRHWWRRLQVDQYGVWMWGSIIGMLLPCLIGAAFLRSDYTGPGREWYAAAQMASDVGRHVEPTRGPTFAAVLTFLTLLCGLVILLPGQFGTMDGAARRWCDAIWSGSRRARAAHPSRARYLYYSFVATYTLLALTLIWGVGISPPKQMIISANMANLALTSCLLHTLYVNSRFLPPEFRPPLGKRILLGAAACFYVTIFALVTWQKLPDIQKAFSGLVPG